MQWEVSANRLLTASRAGHHGATQLGSHLVASGVTFPFLWVSIEHVCDDLFGEGRHSDQWVEMQLVEIIVNVSGNLAMAISRLSFYNLAAWEGQDRL